ncbi:protein eiger isoform X4 [Drosophila novamexicana]|uniref:protein eiger isoform X4 n=1 Tax=Drosophila novamexicana TaxID=47314 RepID=UPI0011E5F14F|nr:protein eiger isoform X4 [Drosophila novamexicana]
MTAETLKPFITPTSAVNNFPAKQSGTKRKTRQLIPIILSIVALVLVAGILILTIWQTIRVRQLDTDLASLRREVDSLRQRLGINYLEDLAEFQKEYTNLLIHDPNKLDDLEGEEDDNENDDDDDDDDDDDVGSWVDSGNVDDDDDEDEDAGNERTDYDEYLDLIKQETDDTRTTVQGIQDGTETAASASDSAAASGSTSAASNDDNVFDDFTSYNDSKKKKERTLTRNRKSRSIAELRNELQSNDLAQIQNNQNQTDAQINKSAVTSDSTTVHHLHRQRPRVRQGRQRLLVRKAKSADYNAAGGGGSLTAAAHFHLNRKVPHHQAPIRLHSYEGDMYMGHATASSDNQWQQHFSVNNGILTVHQPGLYYVYAQICYNNTHDQNGFIIFHGHNAFLQCLNTVPTHIDKIHTCHTSGLIQLQKEESIHLRDIHRDRNVMLRDVSNRSYFGIIKI